MFLYRKFPRGEWGFAISMLHYWASVCACVHAMCSFHHKMDAEKTVLVHLQTLSGSCNIAVTFRGGKEELFVRQRRSLVMFLARTASSTS